MVSDTISITDTELKAFLKYFYYVEGIAQDEGYNTGVKWTDRAREFHNKLLNAQKLMETAKKLRGN